MNMQDFMFPITERPVAINNGQNDITDWDNLSTFLTSDYKAIVREDTNEPISFKAVSELIAQNQEYPIIDTIEVEAVNIAIYDQLLREEVLA